ncbi:MAG TPA: RtcB family protein [Chloroflexia bacterium]|nr:RtcB family protein [Chloroflexia bacterium]
MSKLLVQNWKKYATLTQDGYYELKTEDTAEVPVRLFFTPELLEEAEDTIYTQIINATRFPGVKLVSITPDAHFGYGVPVGCVILTENTLAMGPVGFDIGCFSAETPVPLIDGKAYPIGELAQSEEPIMVYALSKEHKVVVTKALAKLTRRNAPLVKVTIDNGREIVCTPDHEFMLRDGSYRQAQELTPGTSLMPFTKEIDKDGYVVVRHPANYNKQRAHWIMARQGMLGTVPLFEGQRTILHHKNCTPTDNRPENLKFMGNKDHMSYHRSIYERNTHFQSEEFEARRVQALAEKATTEEGRAYFAARGTKNILSYMANNFEEFKEAVAGNGERRKKYLEAYNKSPKGRMKSSEIAHRQYVCETCGEKVIGGFGLNNHRRWKHDYNHKVVSVERLNRVEDVYCLTVPEYGNFALEAGVFVHNCGMVSAKSNVPVEEATPKKRLEFNREIMERIEMGTGGSGRTALGRVSEQEFNNLVRGGAEYYVSHYGSYLDRSRAERNRLPVDDSWQIPHGGKGRPERGMNQLGSLGGGNHFIELQNCEETSTLFVQAHTGSRGFGHGLATNYFEIARDENPSITHIDLGYFTPESRHYRDYINAVAAGANFAIINRLILIEQIALAFKKVFKAELELIYEISHNLVQQEWHPDYGEVWVHRKGATRAFPAGHPGLKGTLWEESGHPVLIPGSNHDYSYILRPLEGAVKSGYSVNHGAGRRLSRSAAVQKLSQEVVNRQYKEAGILVNADGKVPLDESGACYKSSAEVISAVVGAGLAEVQYTLWPLASLKGTEGPRGKNKKKK